MASGSSSDKKHPGKTIDSFFRPTSAKTTKPDNQGSDNENQVRQSGGPTDNSETHIFSPGPSTLPQPTGELNTTFLNDVALFLGKSVDDNTKYRLLKDPWKPSDGYQFPFSTHKKAGSVERRFIKREHLTNYPWLVISPSQEGLYCKYCTLFSVGHVGGYQKNVPLRKLVKTPLKTFAKLLGKDGDLEIHLNNKYHKEAVQSAMQFIRSYENPGEQVINQISSQRLRQVKENRERLKPIVESILFLGRQNIPLRGHRDDGIIDQMSEQLDDNPINQGNFKELLRFRIQAGDEILKQHLSTASSRATYVSKTVQNDLIKCIGDEILFTILRRVKESQFYSIMFDETTDVSHISQLSLILRYIYNSEVREDFVKFTDALEALKQLHQENDAEPEFNELILSGEHLGDIVINIMEELDLDMDKCLGIGTDGCSVMVSIIKGAVQRISKKAKHAVRCPCYNHALNLSISKSSTVHSVRNSIGVMKKTISFFRASSKRNTVLANSLGRQLATLSETRWVERHTTVIQFRTDLEKIVEALEKISKWHDLDTASEARSLVAALTQSEFIVSIVCLSDILAITLPLSRYLQKEDINLAGANQHVLSTITSLDEKRSSCEKEFTALFQECEKIAESLGSEIRIRRRVKKQKHRSNPDVNNEEDCYRITIYIPIIESIAQDLKARFPPESLQIYGLKTLIPKVLVAEDFNNEEKKTKIFNALLNSINRFGPALGTDLSLAKQQLMGELVMWRNIHNHSESNIPQNAMDSYSACDKDVFPLIKKLLHVLLVLPASVASAERSFSTLRRLKTYIRSRMAEERLTGLALMHIHNDIHVNVENIIDRFAGSCNRRLDFVI